MEDRFFYLKKLKTNCETNNNVFEQSERTACLRSGIKLIPEVWPPLGTSPHAPGPGVWTRLVPP